MWVAGNLYEMHKRPSHKVGRGPRSATYMQTAHQGRRHPRALWGQPRGGTDAGCLPDGLSNSGGHIVRTKRDTAGTAGRRAAHIERRGRRQTIRPTIHHSSPSPALRSPSHPPQLAQAGPSQLVLSTTAHAARPFAARLIFHSSPSSALRSSSHPPWLAQPDP